MALDKIQCKPTPKNPKYWADGIKDKRRKNYGKIFS